MGRDEDYAVLGHMTVDELADFIRDLNTVERQGFGISGYTADANGINYGADEIEDEVRGLYEGGLDGGYITWLSNSSLEKYKTQKKAFQIDYRKEYIANETTNN